MIIGLTGGIGSGKTIVSKVFETMGCVIYNSDARAKELYFDKEIKTQVLALLGTNAYLNDFTINKDYITQQIFSNNEILQQLNAIIHPAVKKDFVEVKKRYSPKTLIIKETALLFEQGIYKDVDVSIVVTAPLQLKIERVMQRNTVSKKDVEERMATQWTDDQKIPLANYVIVNDNKQAIIPQVIAIIKAIKSNA